ncbi:hypothetical protein AB0M20_40525 [Actinoplanes sp. NPDC051633]|uniref:hypothetical protein n=1 Tax=Actinoplanes sp. NPDC051633 TaxID=3155670 RepID=UPI00343D93AB
MSVNPEALGRPSEDADEHLKSANVDDPRSDPRAPATEPAGRDDPQERPEPQRTE